MANFKLSFRVANLSYTEERERTQIVTDAPSAEAVEEMHSTLMPMSEIIGLDEAATEDEHPQVSYRAYSSIYRPKR